MKNCLKPWTGDSEAAIAATCPLYASITDSNRWWNCPTARGGQNTHRWVFQIL